MTTQKPTYVYDLAALARHAAAIRAALPERAELLYAMKANPEPDLLRTLEPHVTGFEAASGGELRHLAAAGLPVAAFGGPGKTDAELTAGLDAEVGRFHVESPYELRRLSALASEQGKTADVLLRVNLPAEVSGAALVMGGAPTPFGMDPAEAVACAQLGLPGIRIRGVHAHLASGLHADAAAGLARRIAEWAVSTLDATEVNVGGGMAVDYAKPGELFDWAGYGAALGELLDEHPGLRLRIEPGRAVTAYCGWYVTQVLDVKQAAGEWFAVLAGGTHHLRTPAAKSHSQPFAVLPRDTWTWPFDRPATESGPLTLVGQLCTPKDVLARAETGGPIAAGDLVAFAMAGAYAWNISHRDFLMHEPPAVLTGSVTDLYGEPAWEA
ncbi:alanine racemase [Longispora albida]|uniref:alanine racemase n=1 Tax=Longispora albida TaxID=203523 RepID=UPI00039B4AE9|nr:alanine racemase [Longispora albida]